MFTHQICIYFLLSRFTGLCPTSKTNLFSLSWFIFDRCGPVAGDLWSLLAPKTRNQKFLCIHGKGILPKWTFRSDISRKIFSRQHLPKICWKSASESLTFLSGEQEKPWSLDALDSAKSKDVVLYPFLFGWTCYCGSGCLFKHTELAVGIPGTIVHSMPTRLCKYTAGSLPETCLAKAWSQRLPTRRQGQKSGSHGGSRRNTHVYTYKKYTYRTDDFNCSCKRVRVLRMMNWQIFKHV